MKRIALALAAATLGTGCIVTTDNGTNGCPATTITVNWSFTDADGVAQSCAQMGIANVDLFYDQYYVGRFACANGYQTLTDPVPGSHAILVEGVDASGYILARDNYYANVQTCGDSFTNANATQGYVRLDYAFTPVNQCGGGYMWFSIHDDVANYVAAVIDQASSSADKTAYACPATIQFPLAAGDYTLDWIEEVATPLSTPTAVNEQCSPTTFSIGGPGTTPVGVTLAAATTGCQ